MKSDTHKPLKIVTGVLFFACFAGLSACGVDEPEPNSALDVVVTARSQSYAFQQAVTYYLPNEVKVIQDPANPSSNTQINTSSQEAIIAEVAKQLNQRGYTRLTDQSGPKPNLFVQVSAMSTTNTEVYYSSWYGTWGAYYAPWYGYGAGYAPVAVPYVYSTTVGSLIIDITDPNAPIPAEQKIPSLWVGIVSGALDGSSAADTQARAVSGIDQAFAQSPYLSRSAQ